MEDEDDIEMCSVCDHAEDDCQCCGDCGHYPCDCCETCGEPTEDCMCCSDCEHYPCVCCSICGQNEYNCECCGDCMETEENCTCNSESGNEFGVSMTAPWEVRGHVFKQPEVIKDKWELVWPEVDQGMDPVQAAADFYVLEALSAHAVVNHPFKVKPLKVDKDADERFFDLFGITDPDEKAEAIKARDDATLERMVTDPKFRLSYVITEADNALTELVEWLDGILVAYSHMAIGGELRHHIAASGKALSGDRTHAWIQWRRIYTKLGNQALLDAATLFYEFTGGGYGGPPWANCCEVLHARLEGQLGPDGADGHINKRMFVDRFWTLEHNGGCFLNKIHWSNVNGQSWSVGSMKQLLNAHASSPTNFMTLLSCASKSTQRLFGDYFEALNDVAKIAGHDPIESPVGEIGAVKYKCKGCASDAKLGHYEHCEVMTNKEAYNFAPDDLNGEDGTKWMAVLDWGKSVPSGWTKSHKDPSILTFDADGDLKLTENTTFTVNLQIHAATNGEMKDVTKSKMVKFPDLNSFGWDTTELGLDFEDVEQCSMTVNIKLSSGTTVAKKSMMAFDAEAIKDLFAEPIKPATILNSTIKNWKVKDQVDA